MALLDECQTLRERIEKHMVLRRAHKDADAFRDRAMTLEELRRDLSAAARKVDVLRRNGLEVAKLPDPAPAISTYDEYSKELAQNSPDGNSYTPFRRSVEKVVRDVSAAVKKTLEGVRRDLPNIDEAFLKQVESVPGYADQISLIRKERDALFAQADPVDMTSEQLAAFLNGRDHLRELADRLKPGEFPKEVLDFFRATRQANGAPLDKLTDTVRGWLQERDQLKHVRVRVVAPS